MRKIWLIIPAAIMLASCQSTPEQRARMEQADRAWCASNGSPEGQALTNCMMSRADQRREDQAERSQRFLAASQALNAQLAQQQMMYNQTRPRTTNCYRLGNSIQCTTM